MPFWNRSSTPSYSLFYVADLHGSEKCFRKFVNAGKFYGVDALILGGDVTGKALVPLVLLEDGSYEARFLGRTEVARDEKELETVEGQIRFNGFYPFRTDAEELAQLAADPVRREGHFQRVIGAAVRQWVTLADERLEGTGIACLVMPGNDDGEFVGEILSEGRTLINPESRSIEELGLFQLLSYGWSNITPWNSPRELPEDELEARIETLTRDLESGSTGNLQSPRASVWDTDRRLARDPAGPLARGRVERDDGAGREHGRPTGPGAPCSDARPSRAYPRVERKRPARDCLSQSRQRLQHRDPQGRDRPPPRIGRRGRAVRCRLRQTSGPVPGA